MYWLYVLIFPNGKKYFGLTKNPMLASSRVAAVGPSPILKIYAGEKELAAINLPETWMTKAENSVTKLAGQWQGRAHARGKADAFCIYSRDGKRCCIEGDIPAEMELDNPHLAPDLSVTVDNFIIKTGNG